MLSTEHLKEILKENPVSQKSLLLLDAHIDYISSIQEEFEDQIPNDVCLSLFNDLELIAEYLKEQGALI